MEHCNKTVQDIRTEKAASVLKTTTRLKLALVICNSTSVGYCTAMREVQYDEMLFRAL
jgi:hypothetical protein